MKSSPSPQAASSVPQAIMAAACFCKQQLRRIGIAGVVLALIVAVAGPQQVFGSDIDKAMKEAQEASKEADEASAGLDKIVPVGRVKTAEDAYDKAVQNNDAVKEDPKSTAAAKTAAQNAEDAALKNADKVRADHAKVDAGSGKAYREALEKRRKPLERLRKARAWLADLVQKNRQGGMGPEALEPYERALKEAGKSEKHAEPKPYTMAPTPRTATGLGGDESYAALAAGHQIATRIAGTGETIGHIADLQIQNLTAVAVNFILPPMILESSSGKNQHYACPRSQNVTIDPHSTKTVPVEGVCLVRNRPPVADGVTGDLVVNVGQPTTSHDPSVQLPTRDANRLLRLVTAKYDSADKVQKQGALKAMPYPDPQKQKDIAVQWGTWTDPRISEITGAPPATKEDLKKTVYKQTAEHGPVTPEIKKKLDTGIDTLFTKIELTSKKAKDLEAPDPFKGVQLADDGGAIPVGDDTGKKDETPKTTDKEKTTEGATGGPVIWPDGNVVTTEKVKNDDGSTTHTTTEKSPTGETKTTSTTTKTDADGLTTTTREVTYPNKTTSKTITTTKTVQNGDGTHTTTEERFDENGKRKKVAVYDKAGVIQSVEATTHDKHSRLTESYTSQKGAGSVVRTIEYYPDKDGTAGTLKSDRTENRDPQTNLVSGSETTIDPNGVAKSKALP